MNQKEFQPLDPRHYDALVQGLQSLQSANDIILKARACGMDCRPHEELQDYLRQRLEAIRQTFFPSGRPK